MSIATLQPPALPVALSPAYAPRPPVVIDMPRPRTRGPVVLGMVALLAFGGGLTAFSVLVPLSEAAIAPGTIKAEGSRRTIAHLEGGIVRRRHHRNFVAIKQKYNCHIRPTALADDRSGWIALKKSAAVS